MATGAVVGRLALVPGRRHFCRSADAKACRALGLGRFVLVDDAVHGNLCFGEELFGIESWFADVLSGCYSRSSVVADQSHHGNCIHVDFDGFGCPPYGGLDGVSDPEQQYIFGDAVACRTITCYRIDLGIGHGPRGFQSGSIDARSGFSFACSLFAFGAQAHTNGNGWLGVARRLALCFGHGGFVGDDAGLGGVVVSVPLEGLKGMKLSLSHS